jgi:hypothetical protein
MGAGMGMMPAQREGAATSDKGKWPARKKRGSGDLAVRLRRAVRIDYVRGELMPKSGVVDEISAHRGLALLPEIWVDLAYGRVATDEALREARAQEPAALIARTARMLEPPTAARTQARLQAVLDTLHVAQPPRVARSRRWIYGVIAPLVAAAALLLVWRLQPGPPPFDAGYELELGRALAMERDVGPAVDGVKRYRADRTIELKLQPAHRVTEAIAVRAFATHVDGHAITLPIAPQTSPLGVVEITGQPRAWGLEPGRWQLTVVVGPPEGLPDAAADVRTDADAPYDVQQEWIEILEEAPEHR